MGWVDHFVFRFFGNWIFFFLWGGGGVVVILKIKKYLVLKLTYTYFTTTPTNIYIYIYYFEILTFIFLTHVKFLINQLINLFFNGEFIKI